jgi:hypothetical protein
MTLLTSILNKGCTKKSSLPIPEISKLQRSDVALSAELLERLVLARKNKMDGLQSWTRRQETLDVTFNNRNYKIVELLGGGYHGYVVHVVDITKRDFTIKVFRNDFERSHDKLVEIAARGVPTVIDGDTQVDPGTRSVRYRYIDGISIADIRNISDFPSDQKADIISAGRAWFMRYFPEATSAVVDHQLQNIVLDFRDFNF